MFETRGVCVGCMDHTICPMKIIAYMYNIHCWIKKKHTPVRMVKGRVMVEMGSSSSLTRRVWTLQRGRGGSRRATEERETEEVSLTNSFSVSVIVIIAQKATIARAEPSNDWCLPYHTDTTIPSGDTPQK